MLLRNLAVAALVLWINPGAHAQTWRLAFSVNESEFKPYVALNGEVKEESSADVRYRSVIFANVSKTKGEPTLYGLFIRASYVTERRKSWSVASTDRGEWLQFSNDGRKVESCNRAVCIFVNTFSVLLKPELIQRAATESLRVQFRGEGTEYTYTFDRNEAQMLLDGVQDTEERFK